MYFVVKLCHFLVEYPIFLSYFLLHFFHMKDNSFCLTLSHYICIKSYSFVAASIAETQLFVNVRHIFRHKILLLKIMPCLHVYIKNAIA